MKVPADYNELKIAFDEWAHKTEWALTNPSASELGKHLADVIKSRFDVLKADNKRLEMLRTIDAETILRHQRQITALVGEGVHLKAENERLQSHIDEMTKMREAHGFESWAAALTDAKRYRWLRVNNYYAHVQVMEADGSMPYVYADELDISIDAAMKEPSNG